MGKRNKERRAAKARAKARNWRRPRPGGGADARSSASDGQPSAPYGQVPPSQLIGQAMLVAADAYLDGDETAPGSSAGELADIFEDEPAVLAAVLPVVEGMVTATWHGGWLPYDLYRTARRREGGAVVAYLVDAIAAEGRQYAASRVHERWHDQLLQIDAVLWWEPGRPHLAQWAHKHGADVAGALRTAIEVLALLRSLPVLPRTLPLPGTAVRGRGVSQRGVDQKVLTRVRALLAKAESTGFAEEAEALSAKAQALMARHALERAVVEQADHREPEPATARRIWLDNPYVGAKALVVDAVAAANRCRTVLSEKLGFITVLGDEIDLEAVELLTTSLLVQATRAMLAAGSQITRRGQSRTRSYRQSFLVAYAVRIRERLSDATDETVSTIRKEMGETEPGGDSRLLPVLAARQRVVDELFDGLFPELVHKAVSVSNHDGYRAGRAAADLAILDIRRPVGAGSGG